MEEYEKVIKKLNKYRDLRSKEQHGYMKKITDLVKELWDCDLTAEQFDKGVNGIVLTGEMLYYYIQKGRDR